MTETTTTSTATSVKTATSHSDLLAATPDFTQLVEELHSRPYPEIAVWISRSAAGRRSQGRDNFSVSDAAHA